MKQSPAFLVEALLGYGLQKGLITPEDCYFCRNALLDILRISEPYEFDSCGLPLAEAQEYAAEKTGMLMSPEPILSELLDYAFSAGLMEENLTVYRDLWDARIMGVLVPRPSEFIARFNTLKEQDAVKATDYFYHLARAGHYIMQERIDKNLYWKAPTTYGELEITVNLSKPEKDPREVARLKDVKSSSYPQCLLCAANVGYAGRLNHPARQVLRQIPLKLQGENWYMQYSPYVYYNEHCIVLKDEHVPMHVDGRTWRRLFDFVDYLPHYFLGSNAGLPIVGGSILYHEHYQGGRHHFPMEFAAELESYRLNRYPSVRITHLHWPLTTLRLSAKSREEVCQVADVILSGWEKQDPEHHAITPIARMHKDLYELDMVLRSNLTSDGYPDGIYHPHPEFWHIKKENIGLIEVMGLAVLPGRLQSELALIEEILTGQRTLDDFCESETEALSKHLPWISRLTAAYGTHLAPDEAHTLLQTETGKIFAECLACCGVFDETPEGRKAFSDFMLASGFEKC